MNPKHCLKHGGLKVVVTGGRHYPDREFVFRTLDRIHRKHSVICIIHGRCMMRDETGKWMISGADKWADEWGKWMRVPVAPYPVSPDQWKSLGKAAGPIRNGRMLREATPDLVVRFPGGTGTADCCKQAHELGILIFDPITNEAT